MSAYLFKFQTIFILSSGEVLRGDRIVNTLYEVCIVPFSVTVHMYIIKKSVLSISTDVRRRALATSIRDVGYFFPKLK